VFCEIFLFIYSTLQRLEAFIIFMLCSERHFDNTVNSWLSALMKGRRYMNNPKTWIILLTHWNICSYVPSIYFCLHYSFDHHPTSVFHVFYKRFANILHLIANIYSWTLFLPKLSYSSYTIQCLSFVFQVTLALWGFWISDDSCILLLVFKKVNYILEVQYLQR
jgi:hypothetical protein